MQTTNDLQELQLNQECFEKFSNFLITFAPRFATHLDPVSRRSFNYGFGVADVHFRASFKRHETGAGFTLDFEESSMILNSARVSCTLAENGELLKVAGFDVTPERAELIFSTFRQVVFRSQFLL